MADTLAGMDLHGMRDGPLKIALRAVQTAFDQYANEQMALAKAEGRECGLRFKAVAYPLPAGMQPHEMLSMVVGGVGPGYRRTVFVSGFDGIHVGFFSVEEPMPIDTRPNE